MIMFLQGSFFSRILGMETGITVVAPDDPGGPVPSPVVYLLHGLCGRSSDWVNYTMLPVFAAEYRLTFIMPEGARSFYADMRNGQQYFSYLTGELPDRCAALFQLSHKREETAIIGASMGGFGALRAALSLPERYGFCAAFSPPCLFLEEGLNEMRSPATRTDVITAWGEQIVRDFQGIFGERLEWSPEYELTDLAAKAAGEPVKPEIYLACGREDPLYPMNHRFYEIVQGLDLPATFEEWAGSHDWFFFNEALQRVLKQYFRCNIQG